MINKSELISLETENIKEDFDYIVETITYVKLCLFLFVLMVVKVIIIQLIKTCSKIYKLHNETIIRRVTPTTLTTPTTSTVPI